MNKISTQEFINRAIKIHGKSYNYKNVNYINSWTPVVIFCFKHGQFLQIPDNHLHRKCGCPKCGVERRPQNHPKSLIRFVAEANKLHKQKYDYSEVIYTSAKEKVKIKCPQHGFFLQTPNSHLNGQQCPQCSGNGKKKLTTSEFISRANVVHNCKYNYAKSVYTNRYFKIIITCPVHGDFLQSPYAHLKLQGCPRCKKSKGEQEIEKFLLKNNIIFESPKSFPTCLNPETGWNLYFDFYLPKHNVLIEFDGYQHFLPYYRDHLNVDSLNKRKKRDCLKTKWANNNGISLIRIKYTQIQKIPVLLTQLLS